MKVFAYKDPRGLYFIKITTGKNMFMYDWEISELLCMTDEEYHKIMVERFDGFLEDKELHFIVKKDCERAAEWIETVLMAIKLKEGEICLK